jgi:hypothetical protein
VHVTFERRFNLIPAAELLVTIPAINDRILLRRISFAGAKK